MQQKQNARPGLVSGILTTQTSSQVFIVTLGLGFYFTLLNIIIVSYLIFTSVFNSVKANVLHFPHGMACRAFECFYQSCLSQNQMQHCNSQQSVASLKVIFFYFFFM